MSLELAFYKGTRAENPASRLFDRIVCWRTGGRFSHVEIVCTTVSDGRTVCASSSFRDGGVRFKTIDLNTGRWERVTVDGDHSAAVFWFSEHEDQPYDWFGLLGWVFPWRVSNRRWWFCSEAVSEALGIPDSWRISPSDLYRMVTTDNLRTALRESMRLDPPPKAVPDTQ